MKIKFTVEIDTADDAAAVSRAVALVPELIAAASGGMSASDATAVASQLTDIAGRLGAAAGFSDPQSPGPEIAHPRRGFSMAVPQSVVTALAAVDAATNQIAAVVTDLRSKVSVGMSQADVDAVDAQLGAIATRLQGIAADPANPVPPPPAPAP